MLFVVCLTAAALALVFGAYAGLAPATGWMMAAAGVVFVAVTAFGGATLIDAAAPVLTRRSLSRKARVALLCGSAAAAALFWLLQFRVI